MTEYIERQKTLDTVRKHKWNIVGTEEKVKENALVDAIALHIYEDVHTADVVERSKINKAIEEIEKRSFDNEPFVIGECLKTYRDEVVAILKRNIGE